MVDECKPKSQTEVQKLELEKMKLAELDRQLEIENAWNKISKSDESSKCRVESTVSATNLDNLIKSKFGKALREPNEIRNAMCPASMF